jgi:SAM-dependent methyltransferase
MRKTEADWTLDHISAFWDWHAGSPRRQQNYFTSMVGGGIVRFMQRHVPLRGRLLDYGCGTGQLLEILAEYPIDAYGLDFSPESVDLVEQRLRGRPNWRGAVSGFPAPFSDQHFDVITFVETIEHLKQGSLENTLNELRRLLKPGGRLLVTTPFNEDLEAGMIYCPFCSSEFHRVQHMRSFSRESLRELLAAFGFSVLYCNNTNLRNYRSFLDRVYGFRRARSHLVAIATI